MNSASPRKGGGGGTCLTAHHGRAAAEGAWLQFRENILIFIMESSGIQLFIDFPQASIS